MGKIDNIKSLGYTCYDTCGVIIAFKNKGDGEITKVKVIYKEIIYSLEDYIRIHGVKFCYNYGLIELSIIRNDSGAIAVSIHSNSGEDILIYGKETLIYSGKVQLIGKTKVIFITNIESKKYICLYYKNKDYKVRVSDNIYYFTIFNIRCISDFKYVVNDNILVDFENNTMIRSVDILNGFNNISKEKESEYYKTYYIIAGT